MFYLQLLVNELKELWENSVPTYDKYTGNMFTLREAVMWTINDFPTYVMMFGWSTRLLRMPSLQREHNV